MSRRIFDVLWCPLSFMFWKCQFKYTKFSFLLPKTEFWLISQKGRLIKRDNQEVTAALTVRPPSQCPETSKQNKCTTENSDKNVLVCPDPRGCLGPSLSHICQDLYILLIFLIPVISSKVSFAGFLSFSGLQWKSHFPRFCPLLVALLSLYYPRLSLRIYLRITCLLMSPKVTLLTNPSPAVWPTCVSSKWIREFYLDTSQPPQICR